MRHRLAIAIVTMLGAVVLVSACAEEEIVLARLPRGRDAGPEVEAKRCIDDSDCTGKTFCERTACGDVAGICAARSLVCEDAPSPVCGCDGITYWNDCLRRSAGITATVISRECQPPIAQLCGIKQPPPPPGPGGEPGPGPDPNQGCPGGSVCARLLFPSKSDPNPSPKDCAFEFPGTCWALPAICPASPGPDRWTVCGIPGPKCTTTCDAIRSGVPHLRATACQCGSPCVASRRAGDRGRLDRELPDRAT